MVTLRCKASLGAPAEDINSGDLEPERGLQVHWRRCREKGPPPTRCDRQSYLGEEVGPHIFSLKHTRPDPSWPRATPVRAARTAPRCGGHSPSARERISDTVLRMVGIAATAAGGASAWTLHLSRRRAGWRPGCAAPSPQPPRGPRRPPRAAQPLDGPRAPGQEEEATKVAESAEPGELPCSRGGGCSARGGAGVPAPGEGSPGRALTRSRGSAAAESGEARERPRRASSSPPRSGPYHS